jgi:hypothetical protein
MLTLPNRVVVETGKEMTNVEQGISNVEGFVRVLFTSSFDIPCSTFDIPLDQGSGFFRCHGPPRLRRCVNPNSGRVELGTTFPTGRAGRKESPDVISGLPGPLFYSTRAVWHSFSAATGTAAEHPFFVTHSHEKST